MPTYQAKCFECDSTTEYVRSVRERDDVPRCSFCDAPMERLILTAPMGFVMGKFEAFKSSVDGTIISNHRDMQEHNKRNGVVCMADGFSDEAVRKGVCGRTKPVELDKKELRADMAEAIHMVQNGYKPLKEVQRDD